MNAPIGRRKPIQVSFQIDSTTASLTKKMARTSRRSRLLSFVPVSEVEALGHDRFRNIKLDCSFTLDPNDDRFPTGPVKLSFELAEGSARAEAVLHVEAYDQPPMEISFPASPSGQFGITVLLPKRIVSIRLILRNQTGIFILRKFKAREISASEFLISKAWDLSALRRAFRYWTKNGFRATIRKAFTAAQLQGLDPYLEWVKRNADLTQADRRAIRNHIRRLTNKPLISIILPVYNTRPEYLRLCLESVKAQLYPHWELCIADDASDNPEIWPILEKFATRDSRVRLIRRSVNGNISIASNSALALATGDYMALLDHDDLLTPHALYMMAVELSHHPDADLIYSDEDKVDAAGNLYGPHFKSGWNYDLFTSCNMISHVSVYRTALVRRLGGFREGLEGSQDYDLTLRVIEQSAPERIRHIPFVLYHWRVFDKSGSFSTDKLDAATDAAHRALTDHFQRAGASAAVFDGESEETHRIRYPLPKPLPLVSFLIPTRDRLSLLRTCIEGLLKKTDYDPFEIIILDNGSSEPETLAYLSEITRDFRVKVERCPGVFNYSALNNRGAERAQGDVLCLLNNDIEIIDPAWLKEMVAHALRPNVGAVGAKLLYPDDTIQHAGVILGIGGVAGHAFKYSAKDAPGYFRRAKVTQNLSAVTGACMALRRENYFRVGGLDAKDLPVAFSDIDLCLKLRAAGYDIVWTPYAVLRHHESASRGPDTNPENSERFARETGIMRMRWGAILDDDPFYNPNLGLLTEDFRLAETPRTIRPWRPKAF